MPLNHNLTEEQIEQVEALIDQNQISEAWEQLAQFGDSYADNAAAVTGDPSPFSDPFGYVMQELVFQHWENTAPGEYVDKFETVAQEHIGNYILIIKEGDYWPDTQQIEESYRGALENNDLPATTAIDGVITNSVGDLTGGAIDWPDGLRIEPERVVESDVFDDIDQWGQSGLIFPTSIFERILVHLFHSFAPFNPFMLDLNLHQ